MSTEPVWLTNARKYVGQAEVPGRESNPWIRKLWFSLGGGWLWNSLKGDDSASPWCGTFVAAMVRDAGLPPPKHWYRARAWLEFGHRIPLPALGCIVVFERQGGGHVGFVVGIDERNRLMVLGGNQGDAVSIAPFDRSRVLGYRWPNGSTAPVAPVPLVASRGAASSRQEA